MVRTNPDNGYRIEMPPGEYLAVAADVIEQGEWSDPDFLKRVRTLAVPVSLAEGEHKVVPLTLTSLPRQ
jgi:hypothetical protein